MKQTDKSLLCCSGLLVACSAAVAADGTPPAADGKPNFVVIFMDDMGYADVGCYGATRWPTPHIDSLVHAGIRFTDCYAASPISSPSRAGLLTGRYPARLGIQGVFYPDNYTGLAPEEVTIAEVLREAGYATSIVGKWHLGSRERFLPLQQGFDEYFGIPYSNDMSSQVYLRGNEVEEYRVDMARMTQRYTAEAVDFIRRRADGPFFLLLAHNMMHVPIFVSEEFSGKSGAGIYGDAVMEVDWCVGQVMAALREQGIEENTVVVFTSDNGPWLQEGPLGGSAGELREGKTTAYEGGVRVPLIVYWKGRVQPAVKDDVVSLLDLMPTFAALSGGRLPDGVPLDGFDLSGLLAGTGRRASEDYAYFRNNRDVTDYRSGDWKISLPAGAVKGNFWRASTPAHGYLLFNLREDPSEKYNLYNKYPEKAREMLDKLRCFRERFGPVPPALMQWGNDESQYLRRQRSAALDSARTAGVASRADETIEFIEVK